ncbi:hypothetical protein COCVIDRAFT_115891 [Bipolaris victoriae FI3]|uniref:Uncharacterized protein n=2 Tax=Bipolaris TaxID=33194 RepID=W6YEV1_COCC2|nr:uncharacterized protein COCCADRAFT_94392 [Bipolaris zeicola 26-R-13]XP_014550279.1 hypothetical protein COCVIDRAFT_115891 [Bipolaris victoriae FI3]EUC34034.1 hypothetical protein COCCADRAFT_94392 [Bipolaris zeicola 26-R-13]
MFQQSRGCTRSGVPAASDSPARRHCLPQTSQEIPSFSGMTFSTGGQSWLLYLSIW